MSEDIIKKVELDLGGKVINLTVEQAQKLQAALNELFGRDVKTEKEYIPYPVNPYPYWYWSQSYTTWYSTNNNVSASYKCADSSVALKVE